MAGWETFTYPGGGAPADLTRRVYAALPEVMRTADAQPATGPTFPLLRYLGALLDEAAAVEVLLRRIDYVSPSERATSPNLPVLPTDDTSDLVDPDTADPGWLQWMGQLVGARIVPGSSPAAARDAIRYASSGYRAGTRAAVADAARSALTGTRYVRVYDHSTSSGRGTGGAFDVLLVTRGSETPDPGVVLAAVVEKAAKPAGVKLWHLSYSATWATIEAAFPTWAVIEAGTWADVEEAGLA